MKIPKNPVNLVGLAQFLGGLLVIAIEIAFVRNGVQGWGITLDGSS